MRLETSGPQNGTVVFDSIGEVRAHWHRLLSGIRPSGAGFSARSSWHSYPNVAVRAGRDALYVVTLADGVDADQFSGLGDEFVHCHQQLFSNEAVYGEVDNKTWCEYLGVVYNRDGRNKVFSDAAKRNRAQLSRFNCETPCHSGCTLKCVRQTGTKVRTCAKSQLLGYVHFSLEEGMAEEQTRCSKRLKRKRGEETWEYTKVGHLLVTNPFRGRGLGVLLLTAVLHRVQSLDPTYARQVFLTVIEKNERALSLYKKLGFQVIGRHATHLGTGKSRPIVWCQMQTDRLGDGEKGGEADPDEVSTAASTPSAKP